MFVKGVSCERNVCKYKFSDKRIVFVYLMMIQVCVVKVCLVGITCESPVGCSKVLPGGFPWVNFSTESLVDVIFPYFCVGLYVNLRNLLFFYFGIPHWDQEKGASICETPLTTYLKGKQLQEIFHACTQHILTACTPFLN